MCLAMHADFKSCEPRWRGPRRRVRMESERDGEELGGVDSVDQAWIGWLITRNGGGARRTVGMERERDGVLVTMWQAWTGWLITWSGDLSLDWLLYRGRRSSFYSVVLLVHVCIT